MTYLSLTDIVQCGDASGVPGGRCTRNVVTSGVHSTESFNLVLEGIIMNAFCRVTNFLVLVTTFLLIVLFCTKVVTCFINLHKLHCRPVRVVYYFYTAFTHNH